MDDLIKRQAAIARAVPLNLFGREVMIVSVSELENLPSAQSEQKRGEWINVTNDESLDEEYECSVCGYELFYSNPTKFCPNCGADMRGKQDELKQDELKPCPFCGGEARLILNAKRKIYGKNEYRTGVVACCNVCEARMFYGSEKLAIEAWNRRANEVN